MIRSSIITALLFAVILVFLLVNIKSPFNFYDEGFAVFGSERVMNGDVPYRDFWAIYPPGQFYVLAGVFKLFGSNLLVSRAFDTLVRLALAAGVYQVTRRLTARWMAAALALVIGIMLSAAGFYSYAIFPALALNTGAVLLCLHYLDTCRRRWLILAGAMSGIAAWVRWDVALYAGLSMGLTVFVFWLVRSDAAGKLSKRMLTAGKETAALLAAVLAAGLVGYGVFIARSGWNNLVEQVFVFPLTRLHDVRWLPYPPLLPFGLGSAEAFKSWLQFYLPLVVFGAACVYIINPITRKSSLERRVALPVLLLAVFGALLFFQALSRYDYIHVLPSTIFALIVTCVLVYHLGLSHRSFEARAYLYGLLIVGIAFYAFPAGRDLNRSARVFSPTGCYSQLGKAGCIAVSSDQEQAVEYIQVQSSGGDRLFVGNQRHDQVFVSDIGFYYLADRPVETRYHELYPGVATTLPVQQAIADELETGRVEWVVLVRIWESTEPNDSALSSSVFYLDQRIRAGYRQVAEFGPYQIWKREPPGSE